MSREPLHVLREMGSPCCEELSNGGSRYEPNPKSNQGKASLVTMGDTDWYKARPAAAVNMEGVVKCLDIGCEVILVDLNFYRTKKQKDTSYKTYMD